MGNKILHGIQIAVFITLSAFFMTSAGWAATYYVNATDGKDSNQGTSEATAWKTVAKVNASKFQPGDQILLKSGEVWREELIVLSSGTPTNPITFGAYGNGDTPTIKGDNIRENSIRIHSSDYIIVQDIQLINWKSRGVYVTNSVGISIQRCSISGGDGNAPDHGIQIQRTTGNLLTGIQIKDNAIGTISTSETDDVLFNGILVQGVDGAIISGNKINTTNTVGIRVILGTTVDNTNVVVEKNELYGCFGNLLVSNTDGAIIRYNKIRDGKGVGIAIAYGSDNAEIYYNLIFNLPIKSTGLWNGMDINHNSQNGKVYNNTIFKVYRHCLVIDRETAACNGWEFRNNIFDASENIDTGVGDPIRKVAIGIRGKDIRYTSDNNLLLNYEGYVASYGDGAGTLYGLADYQKVSGQDTNSLDADPLFKGLSSKNFHLQDGSPAINAGVNVNLKKDLDDEFISVGIKVDQGAYKYRVFVESSG